MHADHFFSIGHTHQLCQDYALSGCLNGDAYAIVCDGCSGSVGVDIGARLLALSARDNMHMTKEPSASAFGIACIAKAYEALNVFNTFHVRALDSTLIMALATSNTARVIAFGDGVIVHKSPAERSITMYHIDYSGHAKNEPDTKVSAPFYLSYKLGLAESAYDSKFVTVKKVTRHTDAGVTHTLTPLKEPTDLLLWTLPGDTISIMSDGVNSFKGPDGLPLDYTDIVKEFVGFKQISGTFVQRRMNAYARFYAKNGITHDDDISIAAIAI